MLNLKVSWATKGAFVETAACLDMTTGSPVGGRKREVG